MMKLKNGWMVVCLLAAMFCCGTALQGAEKEDLNSNFTERPVWDQRAEKLGRGVANIAFGALEILIRPYDVANDKGAVASLTYGVFVGLYYVVARELVGVLDVLTFYMPLPGATWDPHDAGWGYGPYIRPAWVVDTQHNAFNFFFNEQSVVVEE